MGIDVYLRWDKQSKEEKDKQITGFSVRSGHVGYLRESYHGGPYATKVLLPEAFHDTRQHTCDGAEDDCLACRGVAIPTQVLETRLDRTILAALCRDLMLYGPGRKDPANIGEIEGSVGNIIKKLGPLLVGRLKAANAQAVTFEDDIPPNVLELACVQLALAKGCGWLPAEAKSYVEFVQLAKQKHEQGLNPTVYVSG